MWVSVCVIRGFAFSHILPQEIAMHTLIQAISVSARAAVSKQLDYIFLRRRRRPRWRKVLLKAIESSLPQLRVRFYRFFQAC